MWTAIVSFFSAVIRFILGIITGVINWAREHPREAIIVVLAVLALVVSNYWSYQYSAKKAHAQDAKVIATLRDSLAKANGEVEKANGETKARDAKIAKLEEDSKTKATATEKALGDAKTAAQAIVDEYEGKLKQERGKMKVITVKVPGYTKEVPVYIDTQGNVRCDRFSDTFMEQTNKLVDNANKLLNKGAAK